MTNIIKSDLTKEMIEKAMQCKTAAGGETCWTLKCQKHQTPCPSYCSIAEA